MAPFLKLMSYLEKIFMLIIFSSLFYKPSFVWRYKYFLYIFLKQSFFAILQSLYMFGPAVWPAIAKTYIYIYTKSYSILKNKNNLLSFTMKKVNTLLF